MRTGSSASSSRASAWRRRLPRGDRLGGRTHTPSRASDYAAKPRRIVAPTATPLGRREQLARERLPAGFGGFDQLAELAVLGGQGLERLARLVALRLTEQIFQLGATFGQAVELGLDGVELDLDRVRRDLALLGLVAADRRSRVLQRGAARTGRHGAIAILGVVAEVDLNPAVAG